MSRNQFRRRSAPSAVLTLTLSDFLWFLGSILIVLSCLQSSASFFSSSSPFAEAKPAMEARDSRAEFKCASVSQAVSSWFLYHYYLPFVMHVSPESLFHFSPVMSRLYNVCYYYTRGTSLTSSRNASRIAVFNSVCIVWRIIAGIPRRFLFQPLFS